MSSQDNNKNTWNKVNLWIMVPLIMQIAIVSMMLWGFFGNAWHLSWLCTYVGVVLCLELFFYNAVLKSGKHPIKALYPILILLGFAFFFTTGFMLNGWSWCWISLVFVAVCIGVVYLIERSLKNKIFS